MFIIFQAQIAANQLLKNWREKNPLRREFIHLACACVFTQFLASFAVIAVIAVVGHLARATDQFSLLKLPHNIQ